MIARPSFAVSILWLAIFLAACGDKSLPTSPDNSRSLIVLTVSQSSLAADGLAEATLTATLDSDDPDPSKLGVQFETTAGSIVGGTAGSCITGGAVSCARVTADLATRIATARLRSSTQEGAATVTAILTAAGLQSSKTVTFVRSDATLSFASTPTSGEADGETALTIVIQADPRIAPGQQVEIASSSAKFGDGTAKVSVPLGLDARAQTQLISPAVPGSTSLTAAIVGASQAPARRDIQFGIASPSAVQLVSPGTISVGGTISLTAQYYRDPGAGSVTEGIFPIWRADQVDASGNVLVSGVGAFSAITPVQKDADPKNRKSTVTFSAGSLMAGDRVRITAAASGGGPSAQAFVTVAP
jgi:hypothetical protein